MNRTRSQGSLAFAVLAILILSALPALADSQVRIVRLSFLTGSVEIDRATGDGFERAIMNMPVTQGMQVRTANGQAEIEFENGSTVRLTPETDLSVDTLSLSDKGEKLSRVNLLKGVAYFNLDRRDHNNFNVVVGEREWQLKKSAHFRIDARHDQIRLAVFKGELNLTGSDPVTVVKKKQTFTFDPADHAQLALAKGIDEYQFDQWDKDRQEYKNQYTRVGYTRGAPYYGWDDLGYYGEFGYVPGYGRVWRPYGVGYAWDPFAVGYWVSYPFGYTWVSPYAWGWAPYRYGRWSFVPGIGWCWQPGGWQSWSPVPPVVHTPPSWRPPDRPNVPRGGIVVVGHPHPAPPSRDREVVSWVEGGGARSPARSRNPIPLPTPNIGTADPGQPRIDNPRRMDPDTGLRTGRHDHPRPDRNERIFTEPGARPRGPQPQGRSDNTGRGNASSPSTQQSGSGGRSGSSGNAPSGGAGRSGPSGSGPSVGGPGRSGGGPSTGGGHPSPGSMQGGGGGRMNPGTHGRGSR